MNTSKTEKKTKIRSGERKVAKTGKVEEKIHKPSPQNSTEKFLAILETSKKTYDYKDESKDFKQKREKLQALYKLTELAQSPGQIANLFIPNLPKVMEMIEANIFRPLPNLKKQEVDEADGIAQEDEYDASWAYLEPVYQVFVQVVVVADIDAQILKTFITPLFVQQFLDLFDSQLPSEREYLKNIFHKMYAKVVPRRKMMRRAMDQMFQVLIHETHKFNGASEILDILASIISGYAIPLRDEHIRFFNNIIIPLHKVQTSPMFFEQLLRCTMLYLTKDRSLSIPLLEALLKYWPFAATEKEMLFLTELKEVLEVVDPKEMKHLIPKLFKRIIKCIGGENMHVCDRAMCFFENEYFLNIVKTYQDEVFPILVPKINELADNHWQKLLQESMQALRSILKEMDPKAYDQALNSNDKKYQVQQTAEERSTLDKKWQLLEKQVAMANPSFQPPALPFQNGSLPKDFNSVYNKVYDKLKLNSE